MTLLPESLAGLQATVVGAAREGTALARYLANSGARVTLSDSKTQAALADRLAPLAGLDLQLALGEHSDDLLDTDVLFLSPGVPPSASIVQRARELGVPISSEPRLFTQLCDAPIVGITGSSGKTTTTSLVGEMLACDGRNTWIGGNIGVPLTDRLLAAERPDVAVMELSSFQLELFSPDYQGPQVEARRSEASKVISLDGWSPTVAAITNITPNHLDRHPSMEDYVRCKRHIVAFQTETDWAIVNQDDDRSRAMAGDTPAQTLWFSLEAAVREGAYTRGERLLLRIQGREQVVCSRSALRLRGEHNVANLLTAACCAAACGADIAAISHVAQTFAGVPHRLETVREWRGITFVNDSIATSPERAIAALKSYDRPIVLLAGGRDKHLPWDEWAQVVKSRTRAVIAFGEAADIVHRALSLNGAAVGPTLYRANDLDEAVELSASHGQAGDIVLLSPGGTSFDAYQDFEARGAHFRRLVTEL